MNLSFQYPSESGDGVLVLDGKEFCLEKPITVFFASEQLLQQLRELSEGGSHPNLVNLGKITSHSQFEAIVGNLVTINRKIREYVGSSGVILESRERIREKCQDFLAYTEMINIQSARSTISKVMDEVKEEIEKLKRELILADVQEKMSEYNALQDISKKLEVSIAEKRELMAVLEPQFHEGEEEFKRISEKRHETEKVLQERKKVLGKLFNQINDINRKIAHLETEQDELEMDGDEEGAEEISREIESLQSHYNEKQEQVNSLKEEVTRFQKQFEKLDKEHASFRDIFRELKKKYEETNHILESDIQSFEKVTAKMHRFLEKNPSIDGESLKVDKNKDNLRAPSVLSEMISKKKKILKACASKLSKLSEKTPEKKIAAPNDFSALVSTVHGGLKVLKGCMITYTEKLLGVLIKIERLINEQVPRIAGLESDGPAGEFKVKNASYPKVGELEWLCGKGEGRGDGEEIPFTAGVLYLLCQIEPVLPLILVTEELPRKLPHSNALKTVIKLSREVVNSKARGVLVIACPEERFSGFFENNEELKTYKLVK
ncbi:MAG: hypothetical protein ACTSU5_21000 [Promethearchaeota archaeon]